MRILSIDVGTRNMGWAVWDGRIVDFGVVDFQDAAYFERRCALPPKDIAKICKGKDYPKMVWLLRATGFFENADVILVERQMQSKMKMLACAIPCFSFDTTVMISPQCVRRHFKTLMRQHRLNKKAHVAHAQGHIDTRMLPQFLKHKKKDDISDAIMQALYYVSSSLSLSSLSSVSPASYPSQALSTEMSECSDSAPESAACASNAALTSAASGCT